METLDAILTATGTVVSDYILVCLLLAAAFWFTGRLRGVQFRMVPEMVRLLIHSGQSDDDPRGGRSGRVSSFQAFALSIASRVGTGNLAGVATAIAVGGPGAVFWMWVIALLGASSAFVESTLAQLFKIRGKDSFIGGPAYYIMKGLGSRAWAVTFAVLITVTFGLAFNSVQSNTIAGALSSSFGVPLPATAVALCLLTAVIICGGISRVVRFSQIAVPVMALAYLALAGVIVAMNISEFPRVMGMIIGDALGADSALGGTLGSALTMGVKRGLFSNEAGEGSTPNAAATAAVSHPVKQGLVQALGVYTDTLLICTATAFIILVSGVDLHGAAQGISLTQASIDAGLGTGTAVGSTFVAVAVFFFAFTSIVANYYYGEANLHFIRQSHALRNVYRLAVVAMVGAGAIVPLQTVWALADLTMALMTVCNLTAIVPLGKYAVILLNDYRAQRRAGDNPVYTSATIPSIAARTECWHLPE